MRHPTCTKPRKFDVAFPSGNESSEVVEPCEEPFDLPSFIIAMQTASLLGVAFSSSAIEPDQFDGIDLLERKVERIRVVGIASDMSCRELVREAYCQRKFHKPVLG